jgi:hypothetical protein
MVAGSAMLGACATAPVPRSRPFVRVAGTRFDIGGMPYRIAGTNMW